MLAVVKVARREGAIEVRQVDRPSPGPGQVLIAVQAASICGSDLHIWHWEPAYETVMSPPIVIGHELVGTVAELGPGVAGFEIGERVMSESIQPCGQCRRCRTGRASICASFRGLGIHVNGAMAEFTVAEARLIHRVPTSVPFEQAALIEPLSVAVHAVQRRSDVAPGDVALVIGPGPIGLLVAQVVRSAGGQAIVTGVEADRAVRLAEAERLGFGTINVDREPLAEGLQRLTGRPKADLAYECAGSRHALQGAIDHVDKGGTIVLVAIYNGPVEADLAWVIRREIDLRASFASDWLDYERAIDYLDRGLVKVGSLVQTYPLREADRAFKDALERQVLKPVLLPNG